MFFRLYCLLECEVVNLGSVLWTSFKPWLNSVRLQPHRNVKNVGARVIVDAPFIQVSFERFGCFPSHYPAWTGWQFFPLFAAVLLSFIPGKASVCSELLDTLVDLERWIVWDGRKNKGGAFFSRDGSGLVVTPISDRSSLRFQWTPFLKLQCLLPTHRECLSGKRGADCKSLQGNTQAGFPGRSAHFVAGWETSTSLPAALLVGVAVGRVHSSWHIDPDRAVKSSWSLRECLL